MGDSLAGWLILSTELAPAPSLCKDGSVSKPRASVARVRAYIPSHIHSFFSLMSGIIEIRSDANDRLVVCFDPAEAPQCSLKGVRARVLSAASDSANAVLISCIIDGESRSCFSDVLRRGRDV